MKYISNAFSLSMINGSAVLKVREISLEEAKGFNFELSAVGHKSTAEIASVLLGRKVLENRISLQLKPGDSLLVFQLLSRLPEGKILTAEEINALPHKWVVVEVVE